MTPLGGPKQHCAISPKTKLINWTKIKHAGDLHAGTAVLLLLYVSDYAGSMFLLFTIVDLIFSPDASRPATEKLCIFHFGFINAKILRNFGDDATMSDLFLYRDIWDHIMKYIQIWIIIIGRAVFFRRKSDMTVLLLCAQIQQDSTFISEDDFLV